MDKISIHEATYQKTEFVADALTPDAWRAVWIVKPKPGKQSDFTFFRRKYVVRPGLRAAVVYVSGHSQCRVFVNQRCVTGHVTPAPSHIYAEKYYLSYDIADILRVGENTIGAVLLHLNTHAQNAMDGLPGFLFQAELQYENGEVETWTSDEHWRALSDTPYANSMPCQQSRSISAVCAYNFQHEAANWLENGYDDSHWEAAALSGINAQAWQLAPQRIPEDTIYEVILPQPVGKQIAGHQVFDAGKIVSGWVRLTVRGPRGCKVRVRYAEALEGEAIARFVANEPSDTYYDECVLSGGDDTFSPDFAYKAFRYFEVTGLPRLLGSAHAEVISCGTAIGENDDGFSCSHDGLNLLFAACLQTQRNNALNQLTDCPHREQAQYVADSNQQAETLLYNFNAYPMLDKVLTDFGHAQFPDGRMPFVFPASFEQPRFRLNIPEWDLYYVELLWKAFAFFGDVPLLARHYGAAQRVLSYHMARLDEKTGLAPRGEGWHISDWPYPQVDETPAYLTVHNCLLYAGLKQAARMAHHLDLPRDKLRYDAQADCLRNHILSELWNDEKLLFRDGLDSASCSRAVNVAACYYGVLGDKENYGLASRIAQMPFTCSTLMAQRLFAVLFEHGYSEQAFALLSNEDQPGWLHMLSKGYGTVWEGFLDIESHCHAWNAYPARVLQQYIVGIDATNAGIGALRIQPHIPSSLSYAKASIITAHGKVEAGWERCAAGIQFDICLPDGMEGIFTPPPCCVDTNAHVLEGGRHSFAIGCRVEPSL